ncbi:MAG: citrate lyase holo-[Lachnospiraceae bacterium]|nr:citrate lyase holo-[acyl-carrier protein] synthase [Lachnospiraceae bacterium]
MYRDLWFSGHQVELPEMLSGRERRVERQERLLAEAARHAGEDAEHCLVCFTLNIAGPVKVCAASAIAFDAGCGEIGLALERAFGEGSFVCVGVFRNAYGPEGFWSVRRDAREVKRLLTETEEHHPLGRLFDIDVISPDGTKISRTDIGMEARRCLICGRNAADCAGSRRHSVRDLQEETCTMVLDYASDPLSRADLSDLAGHIAASAMMAEVQTTPKPGLVDRANNGSHRDMDLTAFERSAAALEWYFSECERIGAAAAMDGVLPDEVFPGLRSLGLTAEKDMYAAAGANTHKGLIFSLGIICAAWGMSGSSDPEAVLGLAGMIAAPAADELTESGLRGAGARAEAAAGFPTLREIAIPAFDEAIDRGLDTETAGVYTLLRCIAGTEDTNMIRRGGRETAARMRERAAQAADVCRDGFGPEQLREAAVRLDDEFIRLNLSPGGSADLLALTYFMVMIRELGTWDR